MIRFALLGSGSKGNATVVEAGDTRVLIDSGFSLKELELRLARLGIDPGQLSAVVVTHEHNDHIGGVGPLARKYRLPVWMTPGTWHNSRCGRVEALKLFNCHQAFSIGEMQLLPYPVPHDCREPAQLVFSDGNHRLGLLTDSGRITPHIIETLSGLDALILECNHDERMLAEGPYPPRLKRRVGGGQGHLSNGQAAALLDELSVYNLQHIVAAHLSEQNNLPEHAVAALSGSLDCEPEWVAVADQTLGLDWREIR